MTSENVTDPKSVESAEMVSAKAVDNHLIDELVHRAQAAEGLQLTGEGGLPAAAHAAAGAALEGEITDRLGYDKHDAAGKNRGNSCNGKRSKTVLTDVGPVEISVRRDRDGSFEPKIVKKRQKRLPRVDEMVLSACSLHGCHRRGPRPARGPRRTHRRVRCRPAKERLVKRSAGFGVKTSTRVSAARAADDAHRPVTGSSSSRAAVEVGMRSCRSLSGEEVFRRVLEADDD